MDAGRTMTLADLIKGTGVELIHGDDRAQVADVVEDSRQASKGSLFIARAGTAVDGRRFISDAVRAGAVAVLNEQTEQTEGMPAGVAVLKAADVPLATARLAERFHGEPSQALDVIAVTGTNGKTTTTFLAQQMLSAAGCPCGLIGTVLIDDGRTRATASLTTPPAVELSRMLGAMRDNGCKAAAIEASSHALQQKRTGAIRVRAGVFTNLTGDHLDYHRTLAQYHDAKAILFESLDRDAVAVLNMDDPAAADMASRTKARIVWTSLSDARAEYLAIPGKQTIKHVSAQFKGPFGAFDVQIPLIGRHNVCNLLQAFAACHALGHDADALRKAVARCTAPPGRLQPVTSEADPFTVLVDYAHTDDALDNVLRSLRPLVQGGSRLCVVFGCGGDRDRTKRPRMARAAWKYADDVVITSDNPRTEDPQSIIDMIIEGVPEDRRDRTHCIVDRQPAIEHAVASLNAGDVLLIAGKGHEDYQIIGTTKRPFDDSRVAAKAVSTRLARAGAA